jgi:hypothetical protein
LGTIPRRCIIPYHRSVRNDAPPWNCAQRLLREPLRVGAVVAKNPAVAEAGRSGIYNCQINFEDNLSFQSFRSAIAIKSKIKIGAWKNPPRNALAGGREPCIFSGLGMAWKTVRSKFC